MRHPLSFIAASLAASLLLGGVAKADEATEARLRDALRQAITQQRSMEDELARLRAKSAQDDQTIQALKTAPAPASKTAAPDTQVLERMEAEFNRRLAARNEAAARASETLDKWKAAYEQAAGVARAKEAERVQLAGAVAGLEKRATSCEAKNTALFEAANEVLDHLKAISVAEAMAAHEPFVGAKRVELQNLAQDAEDKLLDQRVQAAPANMVGTAQ